MGNAFALHVNANLLEADSFFLSASGEPMLNGWWTSPDDGDFQMALPLSEIRVMA